MTPELGQFALILALLLSALQGALPIIGAWRDSKPLMATARSLAIGQFVFVAIAFGILTYAFLVQDFSVAYVAQNSNLELPWWYRFPAVWGAHEGSLLLWVLILDLWTLAVAAFGGKLPPRFHARVLGVLGFVAFGFLLFSLATSNPFLRLLPAPGDGADLNPVLQDPGLIMHPPVLYMGYVGFSVAFAFAIAALLGGELQSTWVRWSRPWTNVAWGFLSAGIVAGSWWAYAELGWGGWWFWDPVENASFMPWLVGTALLHSQAVTEKRGSFGGWTLLLAIAAFSLSLLGTFLVRSGVLTSVHAFAADPARGLFILIFLGAVIGGSLLLYVLRAPRIVGKAFAPNSRETLLLANNVLLAAACGMVLLGTLYPLLADALDLGKISVGPPYFGMMFVLLMTPMILLLPFGPLTRWQQEQPSRPLAILLPWLGLGLALGVIAYFLAPQGPFKSAVGIAAGVWIAFGTLRFVWHRLRGGGRLTAEMLGMVLAHLGVALFLIGALLVEAQSSQSELAMQPGQTVEIGGYAIRFEGVDEVRGPNYMSDTGHVQVSRDGNTVVRLDPEKRAYAAGGQVMTEAGIHPGVFKDIYVALGEPLGNGSWAVRVHIKPFVRWIWTGALLMALGGLVAASDRRFRRTQEAATA